MHIGILTGGGDVPGLNSTIYRLVHGAIARGHRVTGFRRGYLGLVSLDANDPQSVEAHTMSLDATRVEGIAHTGGTILQTSRTNPGRMKTNGGAPVDKTKDVERNLHSLGIDCLVAIGGDDTLGYAHRLHKGGMRVVGIPKTMDNDVGGTDLCLGFATCVSRTVGYLNQLQTCAASHERFLVVEVMGRNNGSSSLLPAWLANSDRALIAEVPFSLDAIVDKLSADRERRASRMALVVVSEGAAIEGGHVLESGQEDAFGHRKLGGIGAFLGHTLQERTGVGIVSQSLGYLVRSGVPDPLDVSLTYSYATLALELIDEKRFGRLVALRQGRYTHVPLEEAAEPSHLDWPNLYDKNELRPDFSRMGERGLYSLVAPR